MTRHEYTQYGARCLAVRGTALPQAVLDPEKVRYIRATPRGNAPGGKTARELARELGVHYRTVEKARAYETWGHVQ